MTSGLLIIIRFGGIISAGVCPERLRKAPRPWDAPRQELAVLDEVDGVLAG